MTFKPLIIVILMLSLLGLGQSQVWAQKQELELLAKELRIIPVENLLRVAVSDPSVADITLLSEQELMLMAKGAGKTDLIIWDENGQRTFNILVRAEDAEKIAQRIRELLVASDIRGIKINIEEDKIYATGEVVAPTELAEANNVLKPFMQVVNLVKLKERQPLVEIDTSVLEVTLDDLKQLGMNWTTALPLRYTEPAGIEGELPKFWRVFRWDRTRIEARLNFLISEDKARTLANPKLVAISGKEASVLVGGEVPYVVVQENDQSEVEWREYGIKLKIEPVVNSKNEIRTKIEAEITELDWANAVTQEGFNIPALKKRKAQTELFLSEGETIIIAGLIKHVDSRNVERVPWLSKVPILGALFKSNDFQDERTELVITLTPRLIGEKPQPEYPSAAMVKDEAILAAQQYFAAYSEEESPLAFYSHMVEDLIIRNATYPPQAQEEEMEGIVKVDLHLLANGQLKEARVKESSGFNVLDEAALAVVQEQAPYPSFPSQIAQKELRLIIPVVFKSYVKDE